LTKIYFKEIQTKLSKNILKNNFSNFSFFIDFQEGSKNLQFWQMSLPKRKLNKINQKGYFPAWESVSVNNPIKY